MNGQDETRKSTNWYDDIVLIDLSSIFDAIFVVPKLQIQFQIKIFFHYNRLSIIKCAIRPVLMTDVCGWSLRLCAFYTDLTNLQNRAGTAHAALIASKQGNCKENCEKKVKKDKKNSKR